MTLRRTPRMFLTGQTACTDGFLESIQVAGAVASLRLNVKGIHGRECEVTIRPPRPRAARSKLRMNTAMTDTSYTWNGCGVKKKSIDSK